MLYVGIKCVLIIIMMLFGIRAHYMRSHKITRVTKLFIWYIIVMVLLMINETVYEHLTFLYIILLTSTIGMLKLIEMFIDRVEKYAN